jgi:predicted TIM-barrel fold metal-dependent hydrolase
MARDIVAIDIHVHLSDETTQKAKGDRTAQMAKYFGRERPPVSIDEMADQYRARKMMAVIMNTRDETITGLTPVPNDHVASAVKKHPDVFLAFGAIDPWTGKLALDEVKRCKDLGLTGMGELNPARQHFYPNDPRFYPIWEQCAKLNMPILFHGGMAAAGAGTPGGMGIKLKYSQPIHVDEVAADFPELKIISAHPTWPWTAESLAVARHKGNYFIDLSGWAPKYFPAELLHNINTLLQDKAMFGSDWPAIGVERWLEEFAQVNMKPEVRKKIMLDNAVKFLGITL